MHADRTFRPTYYGSAVSRTVLSVVRILIASYFLATATGLVFEPGSRTFLDAVLPADQAQVATTTYLFVTAFAIMVGFAVRPAALLLAVYIFWSGFLHYDFGGGPEALAVFWRDMALLGSILLIAVTEPGGSKSLRIWARPVAPRRIAAESASQMKFATKRPARPAPAASDMARDAIMSGRISVLDAPNSFADLGSAEDDGEVDNIFAGAWDRNRFTANAA
ncbi:MAG: DoxX family protein [Rhodobacter sp.]|nr:DoxX family protein [Rhodobacter sp.]